MNLTALQNGDTAIIEELTVGHGLRSRLIALGLLPGTPVEVISIDGSGPVVLELRDSRVVLGRGIASKIEVHPKSGVSKPKHGKRRRKHHKR